MSLTIAICDDDILQGLRFSICFCPVARALHRAAAAAGLLVKTVNARGDGLWIWTWDGREFHAALPDDLRRFMNRFDDTGRITSALITVDFSENLQMA